MRRPFALLPLVFGGLATVSCSSGGGTGGALPVGQPAPRSRPPNVATDGRGPAVSYRSFPKTPYTLHRLDSLTLHLPGGELQRQTVDRTAYLTISITDDAGRLWATIVLDSLRAVASAVPMPPDSLVPLRGLRWTATLSSIGLLSNLTASRSTTLGDQLTSQMRLLFPILPAGGARNGAQWSDTTRFPLKADAFDATEQAATSYKAADESRAGGLKIESRSAYQRTGAGTQFNQRLEMTASGRREEIYRLGKDGKLASVEGRESGTMKITVPATGQTVPIDQSSRYEIRAVR